MLRFCLPTASPARTVSALLIACGIFLSLPGCAGVTPETPQETPEEKPDDKPGETPETPDTPEQPDTPVYFSGGDGSADNPYQIASKADFVSFVTNCNDPAVRDDFIGKAYLQTADIDMGGDALGPVGNASAAFPGTYDGGGHPIKNYSAGSALFPHTQGARLMNIVLQPGQPLSFDTPDSGALVGLMDDGLVDGCRFSGKVTSPALYLGGLVGRLTAGQISNSSVEGTVQSTAKETMDGAANCAAAGGIVSRIDAGSVERCSFSGSLTAAGSRVAGICALVCGGFLLDCTLASDASVRSDAGYVGGIAAVLNGNDCRIDNCVVAGSVQGGTDHTGGVAAVVNCGAVTGCRATEECRVTGTTYVGGLIGSAVIGPAAGSYCSVSSCSSEATVIASSHTASGILACLSAQGEAPLKMDRCVNSGDVSALYNVGGILGFATSSGAGTTLSNCYCHHCMLSTSGSDPSNIAYTRIGGILGGTAKASSSFVNIFNSCTFHLALKTTATGKSGTVSAIAGIAGSLYSPGGIYGCYSQLQYADIIIPKTVTYKGAIVGYKVSTANIGANCVYDSANSYGAFYASNPAVGISIAAFTDGTLLGMMNGHAANIEGAAAWETGTDGYPIPTGPAASGPGDTRPVIRILAVGNSFTRDAMEYFLYDVFSAAGYNAILGNIYIGGCTLQTHWENETSTNANTRNSNSYRKIVGGIRTVNGDKSIEFCLKDEPWDIVIFQQGQGLYGVVESHYPYLDNLIAYAKERLENKACKFGYQQTWALSAHSTNSRFSLYDHDQQKMYQACVDCAEALRVRSSLDYIIPTGTAIQNGRQTSLGDTFLNPSDELHLNTTYGAFTASCTWFETFTGMDVTSNPFCPPGVDEATARLCRKAAHLAVLHPTGVSPVE